MTDNLPHDDDQDGSERRSEEAFFAKLRSETHERRAYAEAFAQDQASPASREHLLANQRRQSDQLAELDRSVGRLARSVLIGNLCSGLIAAALLAIAAYLYTHPIASMQGIAENLDQHRSSASQETSTGGAIQPELVFTEDKTFEIRTEVDRKYQLIIRDLYNRLRLIRRPIGAVEVRNEMTSDYIEFMSEVSRLLEEAAQEGVSPEIMLAIGNLALVGKELRERERIIDLDVESQNRLDQIKAVLRATDPSGQHLELGAAAGSG